MHYPGWGVRLEATISVLPRPFLGKFNSVLSQVQVSHVLRNSHMLLCPPSPWQGQPYSFRWPPKLHFPGPPSPSGPGDSPPGRAVPAGPGGAARVSSPWQQVCTQLVEGSGRRGPREVPGGALRGASWIW